ncbi:uncharacterized protein M421DRAFT_89835 [Didymella exigua CBS 183.55]|uniref:Galactose oxidase n=1 Tax=Didymella exigua CBS 183.55 TaxID=1150837 RepID=A0A6A5RSY5_9PLEO|nr:uncharacterized protein M421DRAFT_89835 [Didymella exigua CBS 183.55]KAF1931535.1 hypothetical protein M421DRAFT_89835 [Didymella exigua CBS 183.55]
MVSFLVGYCERTDFGQDVEVPSVSGGFLWADNVNKMFYLYGGEYIEVTDVKPFTKFWYFDVLDNTWKQTTQIQSDISWPAFGSGTIDYAKGIGYYYGDYLNNKTVPSWGKTNPLMMSSLVSFDMNTQAWYNQMTVSQAGMLVYFGGLQTNPNGEMVFANMSEIQMYDINNGEWFKQTTTGDVPQPRKGACAGVTWANGRSSFNFGLWGWSTCNVVREFPQMLSMGGLFNDDEPQCVEPKIGSQCGLLLGQETMEVNPDKQGAQWWWALRNDINGYRIPENIVSLVGGNENGSATNTAPVQGWAKPSLGAFFTNENYDPPRKPTQSIPVTSATSISAPTSQPKTENLNVGAMAGGTIGGVVALGALVVVVFSCLRSGRLKQTHSQIKQIHNNRASELEGLGMAQKPAATYAIADGSNRPFSVSPTPAYSPQASPPPPPVSWNGERNYYQSPPLNNGDCTYHSGPAYPQTYHPPVLEPSQAHQQMNQHYMSAELPSSRSPISTELSDVRSLVNAELPDLRNPAPIRAPQ